MIKFEVGKTYKHTVSGRIIRVLFASKNNVVADVLSGSNEGNDEWFSTDTKDWKEYNEPRKVEGWVNVYEAPEGPRFGVVFNTRESAIASGNQAPKLFIDTVKVTWTEGE